MREPVSALASAGRDPVLATPRAAEAMALYRELLGPGSQGLREAYDDALHTYRQRVGVEFDAASFYRHVERWPADAAALAAVDRLATLFVQLQLLDLEADDLQWLRSTVARQFLEPRFMISSH